MATKKKPAKFKHSLATVGDKTKEADTGTSEADAIAEGKEPIQAPLIPDSEIEVREAEPIVNERMVVTFIGMATSRDKDDKPMAVLSFSMILTPEHDEHLPEKIGESRRWLTRQGNKAEVMRGIEPQTIDVFETPKDRKAVFHLTGATVVKSTIEMIEESGKGVTKKVMRYKWAIEVSRTDKVKDFGWEYDQRQFWITSGDTQSSIK